MAEISSGLDEEVKRVPPLPQEHKTLDYLLSLIPKKAQKGILNQCELELLCVDADPHFIVLGTNVGVLFLYNRKQEIMERLKTNSNNDVITSVKLHYSLEHQIAAGTSKGVVYIYQLPSPIPGQNKKLQMFVVQDIHKHRITCITWSLNGMKLFSGDYHGVVVSTEFDTYQGQCKSAVMLVESGAEIVQLNHSHKALLVSTNKRSFIYRQDFPDNVTQVGQKERKIHGSFGACFIPGICKPDDAQLYATRPGMRIWKAAMSGTVLNTLLFKELFSKPHPEIPILFYEGVIPPGKSESQFGPLHILAENYLVTHSDTCLYVINPEDNSIVGSQSKLGHIIDVSVTMAEIFILRRNTNRNLVRIGLYPEGKGDSLYHRLIQEKEKFSSLQKTDVVNSLTAVQNTHETARHSPLHFLQTNFLNKIVGPSHKPTKSVENLSSKLDGLNLSEGDDQEIYHSEHISHDAPLHQSGLQSKSSDYNITPVMKHSVRSKEELPPVIKLESPDLLTIELFSDPTKSAGHTTTPGTERFNPFMKDDEESSVDSTDVYKSQKSESSGLYESQKSECSDTSVNDSIPVTKMLEERLQHINIADDQGEEIVFPTKGKKNKRKKKGHRSADLRDSSDHSTPDKSLGVCTPDSISITSETSDDVTVTEEDKREGNDLTNQRNHLTSSVKQDEIGETETGLKEEISENPTCLEKSSEHDRCKTQGTLENSVVSREKKLDLVHRKTEEKREKKHVHHKETEAEKEDKFEKIAKELHEFESTLPEDILPEDLSRRLKLKKTPNENSALDPSLGEKSVDINSSPDGKLLLQRQESSEPSIYSIYKSPKSTDYQQTLTTPDVQSPTSPNSLSSSEDFYKKYSSSSYSLSSLAGTSEHPLDRTKEEEEDDEFPDEKLDSIQVSGPSEDIPSHKLINNWTEIFTPANVTSLALTNSHVWYTDKSQNLFYSSLLGGGIQWHKVASQAKQIAVSCSGSIVWRLHNNKVFAGTRISQKNPEGSRWIEALKEVQYIAVDNTCAWYIKMNDEVMIQKNLSRDRPCFKSQSIECPYKLKQIACKSGVVWGVTEECQLIYRTGVSKTCVEGNGWEVMESRKSSEDLLFSCIALGDGNMGWAMDVVGRIWFLLNISIETPAGDGQWWQVPVSEILIQDSTALDTLKSLAKRFDPQKLADIMNAQQEGIIAAGRGGVWTCPESKSMIRLCRSTVEGHSWEELLLIGIASTAAWKFLSASACHGDSGIVWAIQPSGDIFTFSPISDKCGSISRPVNRGGFVCISSCQDAVWILTDESRVFIRSGITSRDPQGVEWCNLDISQLGDASLISIACSTHNVWAIDSDGMIYQRIGVKAPSSHSLNPAWLPVDTQGASNTFISIATGPKDFMVWAIDNRKQVYTRLGITEDMPIGDKWIHVPGTPASQLALSGNHVWALKPTGEILCRFGITPSNPAGDYWRKIPGLFVQIAASPSDELWGLSREGQIFHRKTKYLLRKDASSEMPKKSKNSASVGSDDGWELV